MEHYVKMVSDITYMSEFTPTPIAINNMRIRNWCGGSIRRRFTMKQSGL